MRDEIKKLYENTELTLKEISEQLDLTFAQVQHFISKNYSIDFRNKRKSISYKNSKLGDKNPMKGKTKELHHNYIGEVSDGKGYIMCLKPEWYTGRKGCKHVFKHHIVMCELLGITEIPKGFNVHHIDKNPLNNNPNNLALLTSEAHTRLHQLERATTRRKP